MRDRSTSPTKVKDYIVDVVVRDARAAEARPQGPRAAHRVRRVARALASRSTWPPRARAFLAPPRLRDARRREGDRPRRAPPPRGPHLRGRGRGGHEQSRSCAASSKSSRFPEVRTPAPSAPMIPRKSSSKRSGRSRSRPARLANGAALRQRTSRCFKGQGLAFREVRPYQPGDDVRTIDWNVSARMNDDLREGVHGGARDDR